MAQKKAEQRKLIGQREMISMFKKEGMARSLNGGEARLEEVVLSFRLLIAENPKIVSFIRTEAGENALCNVMRKAIRVGLSLNPQEGQAAIILYNNDLQYQIMKNGLIELGFRSGKITAIDVDIVRQNDEWSLEKSSVGDDYNFKPARSDRGKIDGFFCVITLGKGNRKIFYMTLEETKEHRKEHSKNSKLNEIGYGKKTVVKRCLNDLALPGVDEAIGIDDQQGEVVSSYEPTGSQELAADIEPPEPPQEPPVKEDRQADDMF